MKIYAKSINKTLCKLCSLFLACVFIGSSFSGCSADSDHSNKIEYSDEELQKFSENIKIKRIYANKSTSGFHKLFFEDAPDYDESSIMEIECETVTVRGEKYEVYTYEDSKTGETVTAPVIRTPYLRTNDYLYRVQLQGNGGHKVLQYVGDNQIPIAHIFTEANYEGDEKEQLNTETLDIKSVENTAKSFVEDMYSDAGLDVDMSKYIAISTEINGYRLSFCWARFVHDVIVHVIEVETNYFGELFNFKAISVPPSEEVIAKIPNFSPAQYIDVANRFLNSLTETTEMANMQMNHLESFFEYSAYGIILDNVRLHLSYSNSLGKYMIAFGVSGELTYDSGEKSECQALLYMPLD